MNENDKQAEPVAFVNEKCAIQATLHGAITLKPGDNLYTHPAQPVLSALSHVNETPKNEHDSDDVLKRAPLVRLTDEDIERIFDSLPQFRSWAFTGPQKDFANAIMDAMERVNK